MHRRKTTEPGGLLDQVPKLRRARVIVLTLRVRAQVPNVMGQAPVAVQWGTRTIARLTSDAIGVRRKALEVMHAGIVPLTVAYRSAVARGRLVRYLKHNDYAALATLKAHAGTNNADDKQVGACDAMCGGMDAALF